MNTNQQASWDLSLVKHIGYTNFVISRVLQKGCGMIEGLFVKLERYAPKWAIRLAVWSVIIVAVSQGVYAGYGLGIWFLTPLAKEGFTAEEYAAMEHLLRIATVLFMLVASMFMLWEVVASKWQLRKRKKDLDLDFEIDANRKKVYLSWLKHEEDYHPENWNQIVDELNERRKEKADE